jgi:hypothetical protein
MTRKERTNEYKNQKFRVGVFQIRNTVNGKIFVEGSINLDKIWNRHRMELEFGGHMNKEMQQDWKTYGPEHFVFEILGELEPHDLTETEIKKEVKLLEQMYLQELQPYGDKGYNWKPRSVA